MADTPQDLWKQARLLLRDITGGGHAVEAAERIEAMLRTHGPLTTAQVALQTELSTAEMYLALLQLEMIGRVKSDWEPGPYPRQRVYRLAESVDWHDVPATIDRDLEVNPYSPDEQRVVDWLIKRTHGTIGAGDDPIGFLLASYDQIMQERAEQADKFH